MKLSTVDVTTVFRKPLTSRSFPDCKTALPAGLGDCQTAGSSEAPEKSEDNEAGA
jgi:hypothetical protein